MRELIFLATIIGQIFVSECQRSRQAPGSSCTTPNGVPGVCYNIRQCPVLLDMLRNSRNDPNVGEFLRKSVCGFDNSDPRVCCPDSVSDQPLSTTERVRTTERNRINEGNEGSGENDRFPRIPSPPTCGTTEFAHQRIVGGTPSKLGDWPWIAALGYRRNGQSKVSFLCGGALVTKKHIITAAHCTKHPSQVLYVARLGDLDIDDSKPDNAEPVDYVIKSALAHPAYNARRHINDIAILYLKETVQYTRFIQPICLPKSESLMASTFDGKFPFVAGWGSVQYKGPSSSKLLHVQLPIVHNSNCSQVYERLGAEITKRELCAGFRHGGKDACLGDSGGPMMLPLGENAGKTAGQNTGKTYYLIGVVAYGHGCAEAGVPGVYTRTTEYIEWLNKNLV